MISQTVIQAAMQHAADEYPRESCGLVVDGVYLPRTNTAADPLEDFRISPQAYAAASRKGTVQAVIHSHPDKPDHPSGADMEGQIRSGLAWGIVPVRDGVAGEPFFWGGDTPVPPLLGRPFRHGVCDCYALVRDWYRTVKGLALPEFARQANWWEEECDLLADNVCRAGFSPISDTPQVGDVILMQISSDKINHMGVYVGNGLMLHHLSNRLSREEPYNRWRKFIRQIVRRNVS